jgi:pimeloyl-ACP methyl ester carboxylesterase
VTPTVSATFVVDGLWVHRRIAGAHEPVVVFVHGAADRSATFVRVARHLGDVTCVRYDRRGYAKSLLAGDPPAAAGSVVLAAQVDDVLAVVAACDAADSSRLVLAGHSHGALIALAAAVRVPTVVGAVVAYEPPTPWLGLWGTGTGGGAAARAAAATHSDDPDGDAMEAFLRRMIGDDRWQALGANVRAARRAEGPALVADLAAARAAGDVDLAGLDVPVVLGVGTATSARHIAAVQWLGDHLPHAQTVVIDGADHGAHLTHPAEVADLVRAGLAHLAV